MNKMRVPSKVILQLALLRALVSHVLCDEQRASLGFIQGRLQFPDKRAFNETTPISINHNEYQTYSRPDGTFVFYDISPGVHVLDVHSQVYLFPQIKCQFLEDDMENPTCLEYAFPGAPKVTVSHPFVLTALATFEYFEAKRAFSLASIIKNPMMLMMLFSVVLMYFMPKMMDGLEPEEKARLKQQMAMQQDPTKMLGQLWGDVTGSGGATESPGKSQKKIKK